MSYNYSPLSQDKLEVRLLEIHPQEPNQQQVICSIVKASLEDDGLDYTALSYVWGSAATTLPITLGGQEVQVTENLHQALQQLRKLDQHNMPKLWVDALCINQRDDDEKGQQVQLMSKIYSQARQVYIWLGPEDESSTRALHQLRMIGSVFQEIKARPDYGAPIIQSFVRTVLEQSESTIDFAQIGEFFQRPWWNRVWVIQEVVLAKKAYVVCGNHSDDWDDISGSWTAFEWMILYANTHPKYRQVYTVLGDIFPKIAHFATGSSNYKESNGRGLSLFDMIFFTLAGGSIQSTDPRDRIYGVLGLLREKDRAKIPVDYSSQMTLSKLLFFAAKALLEEHGPDTLSHRTHTPLADSLPSWVPDWTIKTVPTIGGINPGTNHYDASKGTNWEPKVFETSYENSVVLLPGIMVTRVGQIGTEFMTHPNSPMYLGDCRLWLLELEALVKGTTKDPLLLNEFMKNVWRVPMADLGLVERAGDDPGSLHGHGVLKGTVSPPENTEGKDEEWIASESWNYRRAWKIYHRCAFTALGDGRPGLGPADMQTNDQVVIFAGGHTPFVVRETNNGYQLVGSAYIFGYMDGELFEDHPVLQDIRIL